MDRCLAYAIDEGGIDWGDFTKTVGGDTLDETKQNVFDPLNAPFRKVEKAQEVLNLADKANDARKAADKFNDSLKPGGKLIGNPVSNPTIREVPGGTKEAEALVKELTSGATVHKRLPDGGAVYKLPSGGFVTYRPTSKSGPPTVNVNVPGQDGITKVKFTG